MRGTESLSHTESQLEPKNLLSQSYQYQRIGYRLNLNPQRIRQITAKIVTNQMLSPISSPTRSPASSYPLPYLANG